MKDIFFRNRRGNLCLLNLCGSGERWIFLAPQGSCFFLSSYYITIIKDSDFIISMMPYPFIFPSVKKIDLFSFQYRLNN